VSENVEQNGTTEGASPEVQPAPETAKSAKPNKFQQKQIQKYVERLRRHMAKGLSEEKARQVMAKEDYDNLSPDKKIQRMESLISALFQGLQGDINNLRHNDSELADALDINFRAFAKMLLKLGVGIDEQKAAVAEAKAEIEAEQKKREEDRAAVEEEARKARDDAAAIAQAKEPSQEPAEAPAVPEGATEFSG
jgi:uncharacterized protein YoaH (UPF0181 family)